MSAVNEPRGFRHQSKAATRNRCTGLIKQRLWAPRVGESCPGTPHRVLDIKGVGRELAGIHQADTQDATFWVWRLWYANAARLENWRQHCAEHSPHTPAGDVGPRKGFSVAKTTYSLRQVSSVGIQPSVVQGTWLSVSSDSLSKG